MKMGVVESNLKIAEEKMGAVFPEQYKEFFKLVNNAEIGKWILSPIKDCRNPKKTWDDVVKQNVEIREEGISKHLIAIGAGDKLCFLVNQREMADAIYI